MILLFGPAFMPPQPPLPANPVPPSLRFNMKVVDHTINYAFFSGKLSAFLYQYP
jgi:hypothetical protein